MAQASKDPNSSFWTLRFRQHKTVILLFVEPSQSFHSIKSDLLEAIKHTGLTSLNGHDIPTDSGDLVFGVPRDRNDISKGWVGIDIPFNNEETVGQKKNVGGKKSVLNASPSGAGLKDGAMIAFKFRNEGARTDEEGTDLEDDDWDVVMPSYDEDYADKEQIF